MEQNTLLQIARLRTLAARKGKLFDVVRFARDHEFAKSTLESLLNTDDEELLIAGLKMMESLKMLAVPAPSAAAPAPSSAKKSEPPAPTTAKYVGRLR